MWIYLASAAHGGFAMQLASQQMKRGHGEITEGTAVSGERRVQREAEPSAKHTPTPPKATDIVF